MLHHRLFQPFQSFWTAATLFAAVLPFAPGPDLLAQLRNTSSSLANTTPATPNGTDLSDAPCAPPPTPSPTALTGHHVETSLSLGAFAQITPTRLQTNSYYGFQTGTQTQGIAPTAGVLGTFRQQFRPWLGYALDMGYTRVDERYTYGGTSSLDPDLHIPSNLYELSLSYIVQEHLTPRLNLFADVGAGAVTVLPINRSAAPFSVNFRPEGVTGFGLDLSLAHNLAFRAEYRGLIYKNPDFGGLQKSTTWTSEPTLSLVYRFGKANKTRTPTTTHP